MPYSLRWNLEGRPLERPRDTVCIRTRVTKLLLPQTERLLVGIAPVRTRSNLVGRATFLDQTLTHLGDDVRVLAIEEEPSSREWNIAGRLVIKVRRTVSGDKVVATVATTDIHTVTLGGTVGVGVPLDGGDVVGVVVDDDTGVNTTTKDHLSTDARILGPTVVGLVPLVGSVDRRGNREASLLDSSLTVGPDNKDGTPRLTLSPRKLRNLRSVLLDVVPVSATETFLIANLSTKHRDQIATSSHQSSFRSSGGSVEPPH